MAKSRAAWGSVRKLPSGRYQIRYDINGDHRTGDVTYTTKRDAHAALAALRTDFERGTWVDPTAAKDTTLREYATRWLELRPNLAPRTIELYESELRLHILPVLGDHTLADLSVVRVREWNAEMIRTTNGATTPAKSYRLLRTILGTAVEDSLLRANPCSIKGAGVERASDRPKCPRHLRRTPVVLDGLRAPRPQPNRRTNERPASASCGNFRRDVSSAQLIE